MQYINNIKHMNCLFLRCSVMLSIFINFNAHVHVVQILSCNHAIVFAPRRITIITCGRIDSEVWGRRASYPPTLAYDPHILKSQDTTRIRRDLQNDWPECSWGKCNWWCYCIHIRIIHVLNIIYAWQVQYKKKSEQIVCHYTLHWAKWLRNLSQKNMFNIYIYTHDWNHQRLGFTALTGWRPEDCAHWTSPNIAHTMENPKRNIGKKQHRSEIQWAQQA